MTVPSCSPQVLAAALLLAPLPAAAQTLGLAVRHGAGVADAEWGVQASWPLRPGLALHADVWRRAPLPGTQSDRTAHSQTIAKTSHAPVGATLGLKQHLGRASAGMQPFAQPFVGVSRTALAQNLPLLIPTPPGAPLSERPPAAAYAVRTGGTVGLDVRAGARVVLTAEAGLLIDTPLRSPRPADSYAVGRLGAAYRFR